MLSELFAEDPQRFETLSVKFESPGTETSLLLDYSKNLIDATVLDHLFALAREADIEKSRDAMFAGEHINTSENRAVLHVALRDTTGKNYGRQEEGVEEIHQVLAHVRDFSQAVRSGSHKGYTGKTIDTVVNIGIGGSDLGPVMITEALAYYAGKERPITPYFCSNIDGTHLSEILRKCNPETTIFIIASKTFTTQETLTNANSAKDWFLDSAKDVSALSTMGRTSGIADIFMMLYCVGSESTRGQTLCCAIHQYQSCYRIWY